MWPLEMWPTFGPMLGGIVVNVTGPCILGGDRFKCKFGDTVVDGIYWGNMMQVGPLGGPNTYKISAHIRTFHKSNIGLDVYYIALKFFLLWK